MHKKDWQQILIMLILIFGVIGWVYLFIHHFEIAMCIFFINFADNVKGMIKK